MARIFHSQENPLREHGEQGRRIFFGCFVFEQLRMTRCLSSEQILEDEIHMALTALLTYITNGIVCVVNDKSDQ